MPPKNNLSVTISHEEINELPLGAFAGKVLVVSDEKLIPRVMDEVREHKVVGFDTETKPVFVRGQQNKVSLIQIALPDKVFLVRVKFTGMPASLVRFLESDETQKAGVALRDDIKALQRLKLYQPDGFIELADMSKQAGLQVESVKKLTALLLGFRISKSAQTSNWEAEVLNEKQISYAATDAWVCLEIYHKLRTLVK
ncbi:MAG: 3'-5' exonuclease domain-containing protein 2 [Cyclobacteriaceae bacterium]|nr:3'-5' exonuclease domain-containing protein 2 [Cyclobacteriaceae bacterium]